jgi:AraC-like DNA-binding protein
MTVYSETRYSCTYIQNVFKEITGRSVMEYYKITKLEKAKDLIREGDYTFTEISSTLNYSSLHYFSKIFKKYKGESRSFTGLPVITDYLEGYEKIYLGKWHIAESKLPRDYGFKGHNFAHYGFPGSRFYKNLVFDQGLGECMIPPSFRSTLPFMKHLKINPSIRNMFLRCGELMNFHGKNGKR